MNRATNKTVTTTREHPSGLDLLITIIFKTVFPLWERYSGDVPKKALQNLDRENDWPRGVAAVSVKRLSRDKQLRQQISDLF
jgi:hypothetical protein